MNTSFKIVLLFYTFNDNVSSLFWKEIFKAKNQTGMKVFDFWRMKNLHCGFHDTNNLYRHDYIDRINKTCIKEWYIMFDDNNYVKYTESSEDEMSGNLEMVLQKTPDFANPPRTMTNDQFLTNQNKYEYLTLNQDSSNIYYGIYFDQSDPANCPQFVWSQAGSPYTANADPLTFSNIETRDQFYVILNMYDRCQFEATSQIENSGPCPVPTIPIVSTSMTYVTTQSGANLNLDCSFDSMVDVSGVKWAFTDRNNVYREVNETTNASKYGGSTISTPSLTVKSFSQSDEGLYSCIVENFMGPGTSHAINASVAPYVEPMCPCNCDYKDKLDYWAAQNQTNHTMEEWREILAPVLEKLEKELKVDTSNLSSTVNKRISAKDSRPSSQKLGMLGIVCLSLIVGGIILVDITSLPRHCQTAKSICTGGS
ncbi:uncharacterized protein LOC143062383 isoform X2 [Mytilus galloprovincialis]|uniref:uncharacterized protein LOC143062383 isoform X2 n=1 Tax=Mytilus galloprovincialis TaxID=29158 RepID=UPI003F7C7454